MAHEWNRGVLAKSSWHKLEEVGKFTDGQSAIIHGEASGAWPVAVEREKLFTMEGLQSPRDGVLAMYAAHPPRVLGVVGDRYRATLPAEWRNLVIAANDAGAKPVGAFSLYGGARVLATFEVANLSGLRTHMLLVDSFDGSMALTMGLTCIDVVCANTLSVAMKLDGGQMARLRHTASLETKVEALRVSIGEAIKKGESIRDTYEAAKSKKLDREQARSIFDALFPPSLLPEGRAKTIADKARAEAEQAAALEVNNRGANLATIWSAATYLVDRTGDGEPRETRGDGMTSMLFGSRAKRVNEIQTIIEVVLKDGTVVPMSATEAHDNGIGDGDIGRAVLDDMLGPN